VNSQIETFLALDQKEPGMWSLAQGQNSLLLKEGLIGNKLGAFVELHRAIPVPDKDVPLADILEFRRRRFDEPQMIRSQIDSFVADLSVADDKPSELTKLAAKVDAACADALRVAKEWRFPIRLSSLKASLDLRPFTSLAAGGVGLAALGPELERSLPAAALCFAAASVKIGADFGVQRIKPRQGPYRYVAHFHSELF
jgi:hypothetical protein